jgi:hypothetical protein
LLTIWNLNSSPSCWPPTAGVDVRTATAIAQSAMLFTLPNRFTTLVGNHVSYLQVRIGDRPRSHVIGRSAAEIARPASSWSTRFSVF